MRFHVTRDHFRFVLTFRGRLALMAALALVLAGHTVCGTGDHAESVIHTAYFPSLEDGGCSAWVCERTDGTTLSRAPGCTRVADRDSVAVCWCDGEPTVTVEPLRGELPAKC